MLNVAKLDRQPVEGKPHIFFDDGFWFATCDIADGVGDSLQDVWEDYVADRSRAAASFSAAHAMWLAYRRPPSQLARLCGLVKTLFAMVRAERFAAA